MCNSSRRSRRLGTSVLPSQPRSLTISKMSIKHILITEPTNPVLRQLAMGFLDKPDSRLLCFEKGEGGDEEHRLQMLFATDEGYLRSRNCREITVYEIWHTVNAADSIEECRKKTER